MSSELQEPIPLRTLSRRGDYSTKDGPVAVSHTIAETGITVQDEPEPSPPEHEGLSLPPMDKGSAAWSFVAGGFLIETLVWGFGFTYAHPLLSFWTCKLSNMQIRGIPRILSP